MIEAALASGRAKRRCRFEVFARRLPAGRRFGVVAGTGRLMDAVADFRFDGATVEWLAREGVVNPATLEKLHDTTFSGSIEGYAEGELFFPNSPVLSVTGTFAEAVALETLALSVLNHDSAIAGAAARMVAAADGRPLSEMGSRRTHEEAAIASARAAHIAGFGATSNLAAGEQWGVPTMGTAAHSFTLLHDSEEEAFRAQVAALGPGTTLLVDTYDVERGVETAVRVAGPDLGAVRLDSGDLPQLVRQVRAQLDSLGATNTRITVTNDLDEYTIAALRGTPSTRSASAPPSSPAPAPPPRTSSTSSSRSRRATARGAPSRRPRAARRRAAPPSAAAASSAPTASPAPNSSSSTRRTTASPTGPPTATSCAMPGRASAI